ncbi:glycoside hydrolase family 88 protein [Salegentibacter sp. F188]|uniref:Glycoside hydrolase family 88 protein n=1 Tax=Autumnicola patrickiae TaxID=3075591 RepID=A0ABU3E3C0_9FLAO|nr:glycoside hydrolase family 88 protein [Salegentibacter sp. F188]MDT0690472.1 glycoside hydrolase family 88 protein [Salegentibacter sp. F188]
MKNNRLKFSLSRNLQILMLMLTVFFSSCATQKEIPADRIDATLELAAEQYKYMANQLPKDGSFPKTYYSEEDRFETSGSEWWVSGFYPGTLLYLYEETSDPELLEEAERILEDLEKEQYNTSTHDLGFMMFDSFGNANILDPQERYDEILMNSAKSLATRFDEEVGAIRSWDSNDNSFLVIIDNMMNLELLIWATEHSGDDRYRDIAITHANTTMEHHFRPDNSTYHVINYNENTGEVKEKRTAQGAADESAWARGQAWGLYGFTEMYRKTKDEKYLDQAVKIAEFMLNHPNMPADNIPYWDFNAPNIPDALRDSSAGAIMASALLELSEYVDESKKEKYFTAAETALNTLMSPEYLAEEGTNGGFILKHGVGHLPENSEVDVPLTYGDYYFVEALKRYQEQ